jgi:hypothetical protein
LKVKQVVLLLEMLSAFDEFQYLLVGGVGEEGLEMGEESLERFFRSTRTLAGFAAM